MKVGKSIGFGTIFLVLISIGCDRGKFNLGSLTGSQPESETTPFAVLSMAPTQDCCEKLMPFINSDHDPGKLSDRELQKLLSGIDSRQRAAAIIYKSTDGVAEPLVYLPVADYERFLDALARRVKLKRAVASTIMFGPNKLVIMNVGNHAVIGLSLKAIKQGPQSPSAFLKELPEDADFVFQWNSHSADKRVKETLIRLLKKSIGEEFARLVSRSKSLDCSLNIDSMRNVDFHARLSPVPENAEQFEAELNDSLAARASTASTKWQDEQFVLDFTFSSEQVSSTLAAFGHAAKSYFKSHNNLYASHSSSGAPFGLSRIHNSGDSGSAFPSGAFSSDCGTRRRG